MKDYLKLAAIVALFILGSASETYARPPNHNERSLQRYHNMLARDAMVQQQAANRRQQQQYQQYQNGQYQQAPRYQQNDWATLYYLFKGQE